MNSAEFLLWVRGTGLNIAMTIFTVGMAIRLVEILMLGRKQNLAELRANGTGAGFRTIISRSLPPDKNTARRSMFTFVAGYGFHIGLFVVIFLLTPHIQLFESLLGFGWPTLATPVVDFFTVIAMVSLLALLFYRLTHPVVKYLSTSQDYLIWALTFLPLLTGYMSYHHLWFSYSWLLGLHIISVELMLIMFPFTKLTHAFTLFISRWYTGMMAGERGVQS
jgi:nitrate reductase gamma subunit